ncbi:hypothetical protein Tco_0157451, partial [Tanacetum coccineum]
HFMLKNGRRTIAEKSRVLRMLESGKRSPYCTLPGVKLDERRYVLSSYSLLYGLP